MFDQSCKVAVWCMQTSKSRSLVFGIIHCCVEVFGREGVGRWSIMTQDDSASDQRGEYG